MTEDCFKVSLDKLTSGSELLIAAVSGGIDSMCLAELLTKTSHPFVMAHCNFNLRGEESDGDFIFVRDWADRHSVPFYSKSFDTLSYAESKGISIEMAARELRYGWFSQLCKELGCTTLAVAHNANDNVETLFLNLLRGTGGRGLRGISSSAFNGCRIIRPLIGFSRKEIEDWMNSHSYQWREDRTNSDTVYKRNLIRHKLFPILSSLNPSFLDTIGRDIKYFTQENDIAEEYFISRKDSIQDDKGNISIKALQDEKHWEYLLFRLTESTGVSASALEDLIQAIKEGRQLSGKQYGPLRVSRGFIYPKAGTEEAPEIEVIRMPRPKDLELKRNDGSVIMDAKLFRGPVVVREWREGDWMIPFGMKGKKKISDMFVDLKFSVRDKENARVVEYPGIAGRVGALLCHRIDESLKVDESTVEIIQVRLI